MSSKAEAAAEDDGDAGRDAEVFDARSAAVAQAYEQEAREKREGLALVLSHYAFAAALALSPWIRVVADGDLGPVWADVVGHIRNEADARPLFLIGNHTSFLDTVLTVAKAPIAT